MSKNHRSVIDITPLTFGKYKGKTPEDLVLYDDPDYVVWLFENVKDKKVVSQYMYELAKSYAAENKDIQSGKIKW